MMSIELLLRSFSMAFFTSNLKIQDMGISSRVDNGNVLLSRVLTYEWRVCNLRKYHIQYIKLSKAIMGN